MTVAVMCNDGLGRLVLSSGSSSRFVHQLFAIYSCLVTDVLAPAWLGSLDDSAAILAAAYRLDAGRHHEGTKCRKNKWGKALVDDAL